MVVSECHKKKRCKKNLDLDIQVQEDSYETFFFFLKLLWESHQTAFTTMFQQLIISLNLQTAINFYICLAEQNALQTRTFLTQSINGII